MIPSFHPLHLRPAFILGRTRPDTAGADELAALVAHFQQALAGLQVALALLLPSLGPAHISQHKQAVVQHVLQQPELFLFLRTPLGARLQHVVAPYGLPDHFLALPTTGLHIAVEEKLTEVVPGECSDGPSAAGFGQALLQDGEAPTQFELAVDGEVTVKIGFEEDLVGRVDGHLVDELQGLVVSLGGEAVLEAVILLEHSFQTKKILIQISITLTLAATNRPSPRSLGTPPPGSRSPPAARSPPPPPSSPLRSASAAAHSGPKHRPSLSSCGRCQRRET